MTKHALLFVIFAAMVLDSCRQEASTIIGIKIYEYHNDYGRLVSAWERMGINTAFVSRELAADNKFRAMLVEHGMRVFVIFPVFQDPEALKEDSSLSAITNRGRRAKDEWVEFVCPSRTGYRERKTEQAVNWVRELDPDGLSMDFIRSFVYWERVYPESDPDSIKMACFCDSCVLGFLEREQVELPRSGLTVAERADYILEHYEADWNNYRTGMIATLVNDVVQRCRKVKPELEFAVHAVPWRTDDFNGAAIHVAAQDIRKMAASVNYISPMCYSQMLKRDAPWISSVVAEMNDRAPGMILPSIQVFPWYIDKPFTTEDFRMCLREALKPPSRGVVFWSWPLFEKDSSRMEVVRQMIKEGRLKKED